MHILLNHQKEFLLDTTTPNLALVAGFGCLSADTEVLTPNGWIQIADYKQEEILVSNLQGTQTKWEVPNKYIKLPTTHLNHFKSSSFEMIVSDEHKIPYQTESVKKNRVLNAIEIQKLSRFYIPNPIDGVRYLFDNYTVEKTEHKMKYCFNTSTGYFIARYKNKIFLTGNSGKSYIMCEKIIATALQDMKSHEIGVFEPTQALVTSIFHPAFEDALDRHNIRYKLNKKEQTFQLFIHKKPTIIRMSGFERSNRLIGWNIKDAFIDEIDTTPLEVTKQAILKIRGRMRAGHGSHQINMVSTPEGYNYLYDAFIKNIDKGGKKRLIKAKTTDNWFLPADYIENMKAEYPPQILQAYMNGDFVNLKAGRVYYKYKRTNKTINTEYTPEQIKQIAQRSGVRIGVDFNIGNMTAVIAIIDKNDNIVVIDSLYKIMDTLEMISELKKKYHYLSDNMFHVYPDASCSSNKTNSRTTDYMLLCNAGFNVYKREKNPEILERVGNVNNLFHRKNLLVNKDCGAVLEALEQLAFDPKTNMPEHKNTEKDGLSDGLGYMTYGLYPPQNRFKPSIEDRNMRDEIFG